jgi:quinol-cytochrome oxidoreductase complex cytochrome b subunit
MQSHDIPHLINSSVTQQGNFCNPRSIFWLFLLLILILGLFHACLLNVIKYQVYLHLSNAERIMFKLFAGVQEIKPLSQCLMGSDVNQPATISNYMQFYKTAAMKNI